MSATLMELAGEFVALGDALVDAAGELTPELTEAMDELDRSLKSKVDGYGTLIRELEARAEILDSEAKHLKARSDQHVRAAKQLIDRAKAAMERMGVPKLEGKIRKLSIINNGGELPLVIEDESKVPDAYYKHVPSLDKTKIKDDLKRGEKLDFARWGERGSRLKVV